MGLSSTMARFERTLKPMVRYPFAHKTRLLSNLISAHVIFRKTLTSTGSVGRKGVISIPLPLCHFDVSYSFSSWLKQLHRFQGLKQVNLPRVNQFENVPLLVPPCLNVKLRANLVQLCNKKKARGDLTNSGSVSMHT